MLTRRRFLGCAALAPAAFGSSLRAYRALEGFAGQPAPQISARALAVHKRALGVRRPRPRTRPRVLSRWQYGHPPCPMDNGTCSVPAKAGSARSSSRCSFPKSTTPAASRPSRPSAAWITPCASCKSNSDLTSPWRLNADDVERIHAQGKMAAVLDIEGSYDLDGDLGVLRDLYRLGLRSAQLSAHNWNQNYADSCCSPAQVERPHPAWPRGHPRDEQAGHGDQRIPLRRRHHIPGHRRERWSGGRHPSRPAQRQQYPQEYAGLAAEKAGRQGRSHWLPDRQRVQLIPRSSPTSPSTQRKPFGTPPAFRIW